MKTRNIRTAGSLLLCGVMTAAMLSGCGSSSSGTTGSSTSQQTSSTSEKSSSTSTGSASTSAEKTQDFSGVSLVYWSCWESTEPQGIVIADMVKEFEEETGCTVDLQFKGRSGIREGLIPALDAGQ